MVLADVEMTRHRLGLLQCVAYGRMVNGFKVEFASTNIARPGRLNAVCRRRCPPEVVDYQRRVANPSFNRRRLRKYPASIQDFFSRLIQPHDVIPASSEYVRVAAG